jgi:hypothetical protein
MLGFRRDAGSEVTMVDLATGRKRFTLPAGIVGGRFLVHKDAGTLEWYDTSTGMRTGTVALPHDVRFAGVSQDGTRAVGFQLTAGGSTTITIASTAGTRDIRIPHRQWDFDALRGDNLFLIKYLNLGGYQVRLVHIGAGRLDPHPLKDPHESSIIWGSPYSRISSADGRYLFTLYVGSNGGSMVHVLDLDGVKARCVDLPGTGDYLSATTYAMVVSRDGRTLWAASPGYGRVVAIDVRSRKVMEAFRISLPYSNRGNGTRASLSPDGTRIALTDGETVAVLGLRERRVVSRQTWRAVAVAYSPAGRLLKFA